MVNLMGLVYKYKKYYKEKRHEKKNIFERLIFLPIDSYFFINERILPAKISILFTFKRIYGFFPNLNNPKTLNEKLNWKKLYDHNNTYTLCADKYAVRDYIAKKVGKQYLVPLILETTNPEKVNFAKIPKPFVVKANHGGGMTLFATKKDKVDSELIKKNCKRWLDIDFYRLAKEWQYKNIKPRILVEKMLLDERGEIPADFKFHCFGGKTEFIQVDTNRFTQHQRTIYTRDWKLSHFNWCEKKEFGDDPANDIDKSIKKPKNFKKMRELSEKLAKDFDYVRVDWYECDGKIYFGELTFSHGAGYLSFFPKKYDRIYGDMLKLEAKS